jgi:hypothetical protein
MKYIIHADCRIATLRVLHLVQMVMSSGQKTEKTSTLGKTWQMPCACTVFNAKEGDPSEIVVFINQREPHGTMTIMVYFNTPDLQEFMP